MATEPAEEGRTPTNRPIPRRAGRGFRGQEHPDVEVLDTVADGERVPRPVEEHVRACPLCQEAVMALRQVRTDLSRLATLTMPRDVAARIQAALAASAPAPPQEAPDDGPAHHHPAGTATPGDGVAAGPPAQGVPLAAGSATTPREPGSPGSPGPSAPPGPSGRAAPDGAPRWAAGPGGDDEPRRAGRIVGTGPLGGAGASGPRGTAGGSAGRPGGRRGRSGRAAPDGGRRGRQDWVSIAAVCVAFVTFGAAIFAYRTMQGSGGGATSAASAARGDRAVAAPAAPAESDSSGFVTMLADSQATVDPTSIVQHGRALLRGQIAGSAALPVMLTTAGTAATGSSGSSGEASAVPSPALAPATPTRQQDVAPAAAGASAAALDRLRALLVTPDLRMCYQSLTAQTGGALLAVDRVVYDDQPALLIVLSVPGQASAARVLAVDVRCGVTSVSSALWYSVTTMRE